MSLSENDPIQFVPIEFRTIGQNLQCEKVCSHPILITAIFNIIQCFRIVSAKFYLQMLINLVLIVPIYYLKMMIIIIIILL
jgi:hypothetical protein